MCRKQQDRSWQLRSSSFRQTCNNVNVCVCIYTYSQHTFGLPPGFTGHALLRMPKKLAWFILTKNLELILVSAHVYIHVCTSINIHLQIHKHIYICRLYIYTYLSTVAFSHQVLKESSHRFKKKAFQFTPVSSSFICASRTDIYVCMYMDVRKYINILYIYIHTHLELHCRSIWNAKTYPYTSFLHFSIHFSPTPMPHPRNIGPRHGPGMLLRDPWHNRSLSRQHRNIYIYNI